MRKKVNEHSAETKAAIEQRRLKESMEARRAEMKIKCPHSNMEALYQKADVYWLMVGSDNISFAESAFFAGFQTIEGKTVPKFVNPVDGVINGPCYIGCVAAHAAMTELLKWYETTGEAKPHGLCIGH